MLTVDVARLEREERLQVEVRVPADDPLWEGSGLRFDDSLDVEMTASLAGSGEVVARGTVRGGLLRECRRCLEPVRTEIDEEMTLVFSPRDELGTTEADPEIHVLDPEANEVDLGEAIREELILEIDLYVVCRPDCEGLCPLCGIDRNREDCDCTLEEPDPRWDALRALQTE